MSDPRPSRPTFSLDGREIPFEPGQSIMQAAIAEGVYVPHLCSNAEFKAHGSCKVCTVKLNGRTVTSCTTPAREGDEIESETPEIRELRRSLVQFLFTEGNHFCPSCEASGNCKLQGVAYELEIMSPYYNPLFPDRPVDASHPDVLLDFNRCILCELCIRASSEVDGKNVFALSGRGIGKHLIVNAESGRLADTTLAVTDKAMSVCPVGVILRKRRGFAMPIGQRTYDERPVSEVAVAEAAKREAGP
jgi:[NiFe] hydrogenase diaphorase moiety small subunit